MRWRDMTPEQLDSMASDLQDRAHDEAFERESIQEARGFDAVGALRCIALRLRREATRRRKKRATADREADRETYNNQSYGIPRDGIDRRP